MAIACGHLLGAVPPVNALLRMTDKRSAYVVTDRSEPKGVSEVMSE